MTVQLVYRGYAYDLQSRPSYTGSLSLSSKTNNVPTQPRSQQDPPDKDLIRKTDARFDHLQPRTDLSAWGGYRFRQQDQFDLAQSIMVTQKLLEARFDGRGETGLVKRDSDTVSHDSDRVADDQLRVSDDFLLMKDSMWMSGARVVTAWDTYAGAESSGGQNNILAQAGSTSQSQAVARGLSTDPLAQFRMAKGTVKRDEFKPGEEEVDLIVRDGPNHPENNIDYKEYVTSRLRPGEVGPGYGLGDYRAYPNLGVNAINFVETKVDGFHVATRAPGSVNTDPSKVGGVYLIRPTEGAVATPTKTVATIGLERGFDYFDPDAVPDKTILIPEAAYYVPPVKKGHDFFKPDAAGQALEQKYKATGSAGRISLSREATASSRLQAAGAYGLQLVSRRFGESRRQDIPFIEVEPDLKRFSTVPINVAREYDSYYLNLSRIPVERHVGALKRSEITVGLTVKPVAHDLEDKNRYYAQAFPPEWTSRTITSRNPYDQASHYERVVLAERVPDAALNYRRLEHKVWPVDNIQKAVFNGRTKMVREDDIYERNDPRIQEVITIKERVELYDNSKAVEFQERAKVRPEPPLSITAEAGAIQYVARGSSVDSMTWGWGGREKSI
ncbi:MAG: hypothetical protein AB1641_07835 [Thermodesulfobacteriota bacterium]